MHGYNRVVVIEMNTMNIMQQNAPTQRQQELWIDWLRYPTSSLYNITLLCKIQGQLDVPRFINCIQAVIDNEITMHQSFINHEGKLAINHHPDQQAIEICRLAPHLSEKEEIAYLINQAQTTIDISHWPNTTIRLYHSHHTNRYYLFGIIHHILTDSRSAYIFLQKAITMYKTTSSPCATIAAPASDPADDARAITYWRNKLATVTTTLPLPDTQKEKESPSPAAQKFFQLSEKQYIAIRKQAKQSHSTPFLISLAIYATLLYRYSNITNFSLLYAVDNRSREEKQVPGLFANLIPMCIEITPTTTLATLISQITKQRKSDKLYQKTSFGTITKITRETHSLTCHTPFNILYSTTMLSGHYNELQLPDCDMEVIQIRPKETNMDLALFTELHQESRMLCLEYNCAVFDKATIEKMVNHLQTIINMMEHHHDTPLAKFPYFTPYQYQLHTSNSTRAAQQIQPEGLLQRYQQIVSHYHDAIAIDDSLGNLSYGELDNLANYYTKQFHQHGIGHQTRVALLMTESARLTIICIIALVKLRATYIPIDPRQPDKRIALIIDDAAASFIICDSPLPKTVAEKDSLEVLTIANDTISASTNISAPAVIPGSEEDIFYIIYTSGTTGKPKGVPIRYDNVCRLFDSSQPHFNFNQNDSWTLFHSYAFDFSVWEIWGALLHGAKLCLVTEEIKNSPEKFYDYLIEKRITVLNQTPSAFYRLLTIKKALMADLSALRYVIFGGEKLSYTTLLAQLNNNQYTTQFVNMYGLTEITVHAAFHRLTFDEGNHTNNVIGYPLPGIECLLIDQSGEPVANGMIGEICLAGKNLTRGYLNQPTLNQEKFITLQLPDQRKEIFYRSGDLAKWDDSHGLIYYGRSDRQVKLHGYRIELEEIEQQLQQLDNISAAKVILINGTDINNQFLIGYVIPASLRQFEEQNISDALAQRLPPHMLPLRIIAIDHFPLTIQGKLDSQQLQERFAVMQQETQSNRNQPTHALIEIVRQCWQEVLDHQDFNTDQAFFDVGGTSIKIIQLHHKLLQYTKNPFPLNNLFTHGSVKKQALLLKNSAAITQPSPQSNRDSHTEQIIVDEPIAIIGMAVQCPGAENIAQFWTNLTQGVESITHFSEEVLRQAGISTEELENPNYVKAKGYFKNADYFDAPFFNMSRMAATLLDPQQRLFLHNAWTALEDAGYPSEECGGKIGVFASQSSISTYYQRYLLQDNTLRQQQGDYQLYIHNSIDSLASRVAYLFNLSGPAMMIQSGCSSSLVAVAKACQSLQTQECQIAIAGGVAISTPLKSGYLHQEGMILSADGHCRPFADSADGTVPANGVGVVVLKRLSAARDDGDHIYAIIKGYASNNDGMQKSGFTAPGQTGQAAVIASALKKANCRSDEISYVETHGTATKLGDPIEIAALSEAFRYTSQRNQYCAIGSVKSNIGHSDTAAGVIGLIKTALALQHKQLPPSLNYTQPNPNIDFTNSPFYVNTALRNWEPSANKPLHAGVSSFGIGGTNAHVILQQAIDSKPITVEQPTTQIILLSAKTEEALNTQQQNLYHYLQQQPLSAKQFADMAYTLQLGRCHFDYRQFWLADDASTLCTQLNQTGNCPTTTTHARLVFLFPGQGTQFIETVRAAYSEDTILCKHIEQCCQLLAVEQRACLYCYLCGEKQQAPLEEIPAMAQQLLLTIFSYSMAQTLMEFGVQPQAVIGHSLGEYVAACIAGVITLPTMLQLVAMRGKLSEALPAGRMLAVSASAAMLQPLLQNEPHAVIAAFNAPMLTVISGAPDAISRLHQQLDQQQIKCLLLNSQIAFHSTDVNSIMTQFLQVLTQYTFASPTIPWLSSMTGEWMDETITPHYFVKQLQQPVQFSTALQHSLNEGFNHFIEIGSGHALTTLVHRHQSAVKSTTMTPFMNNHYDNNWLATTLAKCWKQHIPVNWHHYHYHYQYDNPRQRLSLPTYPFQTECYWPSQQQKTTLTEEKFNKNIRPPNLYLVNWGYQPLPEQEQNSSSSIKKTCVIFQSNLPSNCHFITYMEKHYHFCHLINKKKKIGKKRKDFSLNPENPNDYHQLFSQITVENSIDIVYLWDMKKQSCKKSPTWNNSKLQHHLFRFIYILQSVIKQYKRDLKINICIISNHIFSCNSHEKIDPYKNILSGVTATVNKEHSNIYVKMIDISYREFMKNKKISWEKEIHNRNDPLYISYRGNQRFGRSFYRIEPPIPHKNSLLIKDKTYLIVGGLGHIGRAFATYLAEQGCQNIIFLQKTKFITPDKWDDDNIYKTKEQIFLIKKLKRIRSCGVKLHFYSCDITDSSQTTETIQEVRQNFSKLHGVIYAAGLSHSKTIYHISQDDEKPLLTKIKGIINLHHALTTIPPEIMILCTALSTYSGDYGQSLYSSENAFLDAFAIWRSQIHGKTIAISWDTWKEGGMAKKLLMALNNHSHENNSLTDEQAKKVMKVVFSNTWEQYLATNYSLSDRLTLDFKSLIHGQKTKRREIFPEKNINKEKIKKYIHKAWKDIFGELPSNDRENFFSAGGNSLIAIQFSGHLSNEFNIDFYPEEIIKSPTVEKITRTIMLKRKNKKKFLTKTILQLRSEKTARSNIFMIHPIGGTVYIYHNFAHSFSKPINIYGIQSKFLKKNEAIYCLSVEKMAEYYINKIKEIQPNGPYYIGGMSFGGTIAYEMAQQLYRTRKNLSTLFMFDTPTPKYDPAFKSNADILAYMLEVGAQHSVNNNFYTLSFDEQISYFIDNTDQVKTIFPTFNCHTLLHFLKIYKAHIQSMITYHPLPLANEIKTLYFKAAERDQVNPHYPEKKWQGLIKDMELYITPGNHITMLSSLNVNSITSRIEEYVYRKEMALCSHDLSNKYLDNHQLNNSYYRK
ncbi:MAG: amino acid adenylation domain-containing protein [Gammaproteobacteria bacterium]|nr:amino acid adenylation domain-containing protein [Gammaproteobacteria bacterium]